MNRSVLVLKLLTITVLAQLSGRVAAAVQAPGHLTSAVPDAVKADPKHYKVEFENDVIRVLRIKFGPHEKSPMHKHPASVAVFLTDDKDIKAGTVTTDAARMHSSENVSDKPVEVILIELKGKEQPK